MASNFSTFIYFNKQKLPVVFVPLTQPDGLHYEVNIKGFHRFNMTFSTLGRYDIVLNKDFANDIPYELILAVSEVLEKRK
jgi:uncharacterized protein involved in high-affinity Fe2+ transport